MNHKLSKYLQRKPWILKISVCKMSNSNRRLLVLLTLGFHITSKKGRKEEEELDEKKETVTTNNDSSRPEIHKKVMIEKI